MNMDEAREIYRKSVYAALYDHIYSTEKYVSSLTDEASDEEKHEEWIEKLYAKLERIPLPNISSGNNDDNDEDSGPVAKKQKLDSSLPSSPSFSDNRDTSAEVDQAAEKETEAVAEQVKAEETLTSNKAESLEDLAVYIAINNNQHVTNFRINFENDAVMNLTNEKAGVKPDQLKLDISSKNSPISFIIFNRLIFYNEDVSENGMKKSLENVQNVLFPVTEIEEDLKKLFENSIDDVKTDSVPSWSRNFVRTESRSQHDISFPEDYSKGYAVVISGESGSGKSWLATRFLKEKHNTASFINCEISDIDLTAGDDNEDKNTDMFNLVQPNHFSQKDQPLGVLCLELMTYIVEQEKSYTEDLYDAISDISMDNNSERNTAAYDALKALLKRNLKKQKNLVRWLNRNSSDNMIMIEKLVIIIDEVGKAPNFARGLVDGVRQIYSDIRRRNLAKDVLLVLVGAGLDKYIEQDSPDCLAQTKQGKEELSSRRNFGTDPKKANVTIVIGPNLEGLDTIDGIDVSDINRGTYSRVLATNTRMLTRGVIPILNCAMNTVQVDETDLSARRIELGSTNIVMDYAARIYIKLNGLGRILMEPGGKQKLDDVLRKQFGLILRTEIEMAGNDWERNDFFKNCCYMLSNKIDSNDFDEVLKLGLITSDVISTSKALRYLSCKGQTAPLYVQDGVAFEVLLQHHLVSLSSALYYFLENNSNDGEYRCERYNLAQAWPPSSTKKDEDLSQNDIVVQEVKDSYEKEKEKKRPDDDIKMIIEKLKSVENCDLVMRQTVSNVQGADLMRLCKRTKNMECTVDLDLFQAMHFENRNIPTSKSKKAAGAFASLGVQYNHEAKEMFNNEPTIGSAGYSYLGTKAFVDQLSAALGTNVSIRNRVVVFSGDWKMLSRKWKNFDFEQAKNKKVGLWTKEIIEPTFSALAITEGEPVAGGDADFGDS